MNSVIGSAVLDIAIMIDCLRGHPPATRFFVALTKSVAPRFCRLSAIELLAVCSSDAERVLARRYISVLQITEQTMSIAQRAFDLLDALGLPTALTASDALVAATAIEHSLPLYTLDPARFANVIGLTALQPY